MERILILGSSSAVPTLTHENTHLLVETATRRILVDCPGSPLIRLEKAGVEARGITDIILTHFHPDHVSGFAPLLMSLWLIGRKDPLCIYGLEPTIERAKKMMDLYDWHRWPNFYPVKFIAAAGDELAILMEDESLRVLSSPVKHLIPTIGLRFEFCNSGKVIAYSCDTEPTPIVSRLAEGADVLIHEAAGGGVGHSAAGRAGEVAAQAGAKQLYLIHYPPQLITPEALLEQAHATFSGEVVVAEDFMNIPVG